MAKRIIFFGILLSLAVGLGVTSNGFHIEPKPEPPEPEPEPTTRELVVDLAESQIGVRQTNGNTGPEIDEYLACSGLGPGYAWCAAFVCWIYDSNEVEVPNSSAWSPSWFPQSKTYENNSMAQEGDVFGIYFNNLGRIAHVGVLIESWEEAGNILTTVEGNTNDTGAREGDGVYKKYRSKNQIKSTANWINNDEG